MADQAATLARLEAFLGIALRPIDVLPGKVGRWRATPERIACVAELLAPELAALGYQPS